MCICTWEGCTRWNWGYFERMADRMVLQGHDISSAKEMYDAGNYESVRQLT